MKIRKTLGVSLVNIIRSRQVIAGINTPAINKWKKETKDVKRMVHAQRKILSR